MHSYSSTHSNASHLSSKSVKSKDKSEKQKGKLSLCKITVALQNQQYTLLVHKNSTVKNLTLKLIVMLYQNLLENDCNDSFNLIYQQVAQILAQKIHQTIQNEAKFNHQQWSQSLKSILNQYDQETKLLKFKQNQTKSQYFIKNYITTIKESQYSVKDQPYLLASNRTSQIKQNKFKLYSKAQKSIQKKKVLQRQYQQQKSKVQISYCTFHPNISKSQKKFKSKQKSNVFKRLYSNAEQINEKLSQRKKQIQHQQERQLRILNFIPQINTCSKKIIQLKEQQDFTNSIFSNSECEKSTASIYINNSSSKLNLAKQLKRQKSKKKFQDLSDSSFYQNRLNRTLQKLNIDKENQYPFQPQLSKGTKRIMQNYPNLEQRMQMYQLKKLKNQKAISNHSQSLKKQNSKNKSNLNILKKSKCNAQNPTENHSNSNKMTKILNRVVKTEPLSQLKYDQNLQNNQNKKLLSKYQSQIFRFEKNFIDDEKLIERMPKKQNIHIPSSKAFFKDKNQLKNNQKISSISLSNYHEINNEIQVHKKQQIFQKVFYELSNPVNSQVSTLDILKCSKITKQVIQIFQPLIEQLQQMETSLDQQEFIWSLQNLYNQLGLQEKAILLSWGLKLFRYDQNLKYKENELQHVKTEGSIFQLIQ